MGLVVLVLLVSSFVVLRPDLWPYYTDGFKIRQPGREAVVRQVLWEEPELMATHVNAKPDNYEPTISADGRILIFSRGRAKQNADLYLTHWDGKSWEEPTPIRELNSLEDELGPELSRDGNSLYFYSNRKGGLGGYDIWMSRRDSDHWGEPANLGASINSAYNDYDPAISPSGRRLYLSSNRPRGAISEKERATWGATLRESRNLSDYDIFVSEAMDVEVLVEGDSQSRLEFAEATRVDYLNSLADEGQVSITPRGDFLYFSSDRSGGAGGFDLYRSRLFDGELMMPEHIGTPVNSAFDDMDPTLWMEGYGLVFSSNRERFEDGEYRFRIYHTLSREVMSRTDLSAFDGLLDFLRLNKWWILALLLALLALLALMRLMLNKSFRRSLSLIQRCIVGSLLLHLLIAFLLSLWLVSEAVYQAVSEPSMELSISEGALSRERLALDIREQVTELPSSSSDFEGQEQEQVDRLPLPDIEPALQQIEPEASVLDPPEFVTEVQTAKVSEPSRQDLQDLEFSPELQPLTLRVSAFQLEMPVNVSPEPEPVATPLSANLEAKQAEPLPEVERVVNSPAAAPLENQPLEFDPALTVDISAMESPRPDSVSIHSAEQVPPLQPFDSVQLAVNLPMEGRDVDVPQASPRETESIERETARAIPKVPSNVRETNQPRIVNLSLSPMTESTVPSPIVEPLLREIDLPSLSEAPRSIQSASSIPQMDPSEPISLGGLLHLEDREAVAPATTSRVDSSDADSELAVAKALPSRTESSQAHVANRSVHSVSHSELPPEADRSLEILAAQVIPIEASAVHEVELTVPTDLSQLLVPNSKFRMEDRENVVPMTNTLAGVELEIDSALGLVQASVGESPPKKPLKIELGLPQLAQRVVLSETTRPLLSAIAMPASTEMNSPTGSLESASMTDTYKSTTLSAMNRMEERGASVPLADAPKGESLAKDSALTVFKTTPVTEPLKRMLKPNTSVKLASLDPIRPAVERALQDIRVLQMKAKLIKLDKTEGLELPKMSLVRVPLLEVPESVSRPYLLRDPETRERLIQTLGGTDETEAAIVRALDWLTRNQAEDGSWEVGRFGGRRGHRTAGTGLALLCYLGWGAKHNEAGPYQNTVLRGLQFLLDSMDEDGRLWRHGDRGMYDQGIASIALAEAYGVSQDPILKEPVERALFFILRSSRRGSEWRYNPGDPGDTSVYGWQVMALKSGLMAGVDLPDGVLEKAGRWLDRVGGGKHGGIYGYTSKGYHGPGMVAEGMFCQQLLGVPRTDPRMIESAAHLAERLPRRQSVDFYYFYYGCLSLFQHQGPIWEAWNERMRDLLLSLQTQDGNQSGSWKARGARPQDYGRLVSTTMAVLSLEVYYRYLPLYGLERD